MAFLLVIPLFTLPTVGLALHKLSEEGHTKRKEQELKKSATKVPHPKPVYICNRGMKKVVGRP